MRLEQSETNPLPAIPLIQELQICPVSETTLL